MSSIVEAGEVIHIAKSGRLILKIGTGIVMKSGENLFDNAGKKVGRVTELIGPVNAPYASVLLDNDQIKRSTGSKLFRFSIQRGVPPKTGKEKRSSRNKRRRYG
ncbi:MAG TPA: Gar1/Naf1 family protein [Nitrososphaeraceae archaeon]|nr:Gar1/Naf1 family protein [Nitrososphaeraceae archaeon]